MISNFEKAKKCFFTGFFTVFVWKCRLCCLKNKIYKYCRSFLQIFIIQRISTDLKTKIWTEDFILFRIQTDGHPVDKYAKFMLSDSPQLKTHTIPLHSMSFAVLSTNASIQFAFFRRFQPSTDISLTASSYRCLIK